MAEWYIPWVPRPRTMKWMGRVHTALFRATRGLIGRRADGLDMLLLTTTGHRSGVARTVPLPYFRDAGRIVLVGSFGGNDRDPAWIANLRGDPEVAVQLAGRAVAGRARIADMAERERLWQAITSDHPRYLAYQSSTERQIPLAVIETSEPI